MMFQKIDLQTRIFLAFLAPSAIALLAVFNGLVTEQRLSHYNNLLSNNNLPSLDGLWKIREGQTQIDVAECMLLNHTLSTADRAIALSKIQKAWNQIDDGFKQALNNPPSSKQEKQLEAQFRENWGIWKNAHAAFLVQERRFARFKVSDPIQRRSDLILQGQRNSPEMQKVNQAIAIQNKLIQMDRQKKPLFDQAAESLVKLLRDNQEFADQIQKDSIQTKEQAQVISIVVLVVVPLIVSVLAWVLSKRIAHPIDQKLGTLIQDLELARDQLETKVVERTQDLQTALQDLTTAQSQLVQSEKMSSLGQLVAGIAHEINNPVNFIHGNLTPIQEYARDLMNMVQLYQKHYPQPCDEIQIAAEETDLEFVQEDLPKLLESMKLGTDRIRQIVLSLRNFSRLDEADLKAVDLHEGIDSTLLILQHRLKDKPESPAIKVVKDYDKLPPVNCYPGQLNQVIMNILANAIDALEEMNAKRTISEIHPSQLTIRTSMMDTQWVQIAIIDNGIGMPESVMQKIFNPFFTTKPIGKGTGMGMSISYKIITEKHHGKIKCFSTPGQGTEFVIQLPIQQPETERA